MYHIVCFLSSAQISVSRPLWGPALSVSCRRDLPTMFMGSGQGFNHKALAIVETVGKVLVSAGFEVLGSLRGICRCICHEEHNEILSAAHSDTPDSVIGLDLCTETFSWPLTLLTRQTGWTPQCLIKTQLSMTILYSECLCSHKIHILKPSDGIRRWGLWEVSRSWMGLMLL